MWSIICPQKVEFLLSSHTIHIIDGFFLSAGNTKKSFASITLDSLGLGGLFLSHFLAFIMPALQAFNIWLLVCCRIMSSQLFSSLKQSWILRSPRPGNAFSVLFMSLYCNCYNWAGHKVRFYTVAFCAWRPTILPPKRLETLQGLFETKAIVCFCKTFNYKLVVF